MSKLLSLVTPWLNAKQRSDNTRRLYELEVTRFAIWLGNKRATSRRITDYLTLLACNPGDVSDGFLIRRKKALSPRSREQSRRILHAFFEWAARQRHIDGSPFWTRSPKGICFSIPTSPVPVPQLSDEIKDLLQREADEDEPIHELRAAVIAHLSFWLGLTPTQITKLTVEDFVQRKRSASMRLPGPNGAIVEIVLPIQTKRIITQYLASRGEHLPASDPAPLITSLKTGDEITPWAIRQAVMTWQGLQRGEQKADHMLSPRQLRQAFESMANHRSIQERVIAKHFRTVRLGSAIDRGRLKYDSHDLYAEVSQEMQT